MKLLAYKPSSMLKQTAAAAALKAMRPCIACEVLSCVFQRAATKSRMVPTASPRMLQMPITPAAISAAGTLMAARKNAVNETVSITVNSVIQNVW